MLRLLTRSVRRPAPARPRHFRPVLEALERRDCPAGGPSITGFSVMPTGGKTVTLAGQVSDYSAPSGGMYSNPPSLAGISVAFSGVVSASATTDSNGNFSTTATASALGTVNAVATDGQGQSSPQVQAQLAVAPPSITLNMSYLGKRDIQLQGTVGAQSPGGLTVTIGGEATGTTTTDANGRFVLNTTAAALGDVTATTTDVWGQASNTAKVTLASNAPNITQFQAIQDGTSWTFSGYDFDESAPGETVTFGGFQPLTGQTCTVGSDGHFSMTITLPSGIDAIATATVVDWWGLQSQEAQTQVIS